MPEQTFDATLRALKKGDIAPVYYLVDAEGEPLVPAHEKVEIDFKDPDEVLASTIVAAPEKTALRRALERISRRA